MKKLISLTVLVFASLSVTASAEKSKTTIKIDKGHVVIQYVNGLTKPEVTVSKTSGCDVLAVVTTAGNSIQVNHPKPCWSGNKTTIKTANDSNLKISLNAGAIQVSSTRTFLDRFASIQSSVLSGSLMSDVKELKSIRTENYASATAEYIKPTKYKSANPTLKITVDSGSLQFE